MSEPDFWRIEDERLREVIYNELVRLHALWKAEGLEGFHLLETQAANISARLRMNFDVKPRYTRRSDYILLPTGEPAPSCKGCFNEYGSCGTPCVTCSKIKEFNNKWSEVLRTKEFAVFRKSELK